MKKIYLTFFLIHLVFIGLTQNFTVEGNSVRNAVFGAVNGKSVLYISELDGSVSSYSVKGEKNWRNESKTKAVTFEIEAVDVDGDTQDDLLAASADGNIYCWKSTGKLLWKFNPGHKVRFSELAVLNAGNGLKIFAGGNDFNLYEINSKGKLLSKTPIKGVVRKIEIGDFIEKGKPSIFLFTYAHDKFRWEFMGFIDAETKKVIKQIDYNKQPAELWSRFMVNDLQIRDIDENGRDDILIFGHGSGGQFFALDDKFEVLANFVSPSSSRQRYAHGIGTSLLPIRNEVVLQYGGLIYVLDAKGKLLHKSGEKHREIIYNDLIVEPKSKKLLGAAQVGGGNGMYFYQLDESNWWKKKHQFIGRMAEVEDNLDKLFEQVLDFETPEYQKMPDKEWVMITNIRELPELNKLQGANVKYVRQHNWHEIFDRSHLVEVIGEDALKRDRRMKYVDTREQILKEAAELEKQGMPFVAWTGHGNDPFFVSIETMEKILEVAPTTCYGFTYAEMENSNDPRYIYFVDHYIPRLAKALRKHGKAKLYFRYKNIFWAANSHTQPWHRLFFSGKYNDVIVPAAEDTNARTQELNFSGRSGMFSAGYTNDFAMRLVDDNPTCWRPYSPGGQRTVSPYLRSGVMYAAYGARYGLIFPIGYLENPGMNILFALMKSGVLPIVEKEDILSIGSWHLIKDVDKEVVHGVSSGHDLTIYDEHDNDAVISYGKLCWAGTNIPDYDYSKMLGVDYRWLNFTPTLPYGMIPVAPIQFENSLKKAKIPYVVSNWKKGLVNGAEMAAKDFGAVMQKTVREGAATMPIVVKGASWSAIRLDNNHIRLILVDPGYIDPQERKVTIQFQNKKPISAKDILSGEKIEINGNTTQIVVPAGSMRFIDLSYN